ncbi:hypothetical protein Cgig2_021311 [Carnegiea gigantea]|uniref:Uncharacterized protein n=1 Tax=Carnegiea gigantea TaxID=171969 RepID=A0A9Q1KKP0_9CARY|nr:hypothetical protein Cgig2_021311 [Carnegiea gigantea]
MNEAWCVLGDFKSVLHSGDRIGGTKILDSEVKNFTDYVMTCHLQETRSCGLTSLGLIKPPLQGLIESWLMHYDMVFFILLKSTTRPMVFLNILFFSLFSLIGQKLNHNFHFATCGYPKQGFSTFLPKGRKSCQLKLLLIKLRHLLEKLIGEKYDGLHEKQAKDREKLMNTTTSSRTT